MAETDKEEGSALSREDLEAAFAGPAPHSNRFFVTLGASGVRIAFTEQNPGIGPQFRVATIMSYQDAIQLTELLQRLLKPVQDQIAEAEKAAKGNG